MSVTELGVNILQQNRHFNEALMVDPVIQELMRNLQHGDSIFVVMELNEKSPSYVNAQDHDGWKHVDQLTTLGVAVLDGDAADLVNEVRERVQLAMEAAAGVKRLPLGDGEATPDDMEGDEG